MQVAGKWQRRVALVARWRYTFGGLTAAALGYFGLGNLKWNWNPVAILAALLGVAGACWPWVDALAGWRKRLVEFQVEGTRCRCRTFGSRKFEEWRADEVTAIRQGSAEVAVYRRDAPTLYVSRAFLENAEQLIDWFTAAIADNRPDVLHPSLEQPIFGRMDGYQRLTLLVWPALCCTGIGLIFAVGLFSFGIGWWRLGSSFLALGAGLMLLAAFAMYLITCPYLRMATLFRFDGEAVTFRRLGSLFQQTRPSHAIATVRRDRPPRRAPAANCDFYRITFRDGAYCDLSVAHFPNAELLGEMLRSHAVRITSPLPGRPHSVVIPECLAAIRPHLAPHEELIWTGRPNWRCCWSEYAAASMLFSFLLLVGVGALVVWAVAFANDLGANGQPKLGLLIAFVVPLGFAGLGSYGIYDLRQQLAALRATYYAVTDQRAIIVGNLGWARSASGLCWLDNDRHMISKHELADYQVKRHHDVVLTGKWVTRRHRKGGRYDEFVEIGFLALDEPETAVWAIEKLVHACE